MFDFPNAPTNGQQVQGGAGQIYAWDGVKWAAQVPPGPLPVSQGGTGAVTLPVTVPGGPGPPALTGAFLLGHNTSPVTTATTTAIVGGLDYPGANIHMVSAVNGATNIFQMWRSEGTLAAPTPVRNALPLGTMRWGGYDGTWWYPSMAWIDVTPTEDWSGTKHGTSMSFYVTKTGTNSTSVGMTINSTMITMGTNLTVNGNAPTVTLKSVDNNYTSVLFQRANGNADQKQWELFAANDGQFQLRTVNDAYSAAAGAISILRAASGVGVQEVRLETRTVINAPGDWALSINAPSGQSARTISGVSGVRAWSIGTFSDGTYMIADESAGRVQMRFYADGNTTIMTIQPDANNARWCGLPTGSGQAWYGVASYSFPQQSDATEKKNISDLPPCLDLIRAIPAKRYEWIEGPPEEEGRVHWGFIAQDVEAAMDAAGYEFGGHRVSESGLQSLAHNELTAVLWQAVRELSAKVEALEAR